MWGGGRWGLLVVLWVGLVPNKMLCCCSMTANTGHGAKSVRSILWVEKVIFFDSDGLCHRGWIMLASALALVGDGAEWRLHRR